MSVPPPRRPTIVDVANLSGVSKSTVSNVLRGEGRMSAATRSRVLVAVERLGYRPNAAARDLVRRRTNLIGVVVGDLANTFYAELVKLLEVQASEAALTTIVCNTDGHLERERTRVEALLEHGVSGVAMLQFSGDGVVLGELSAAGVPAVIVSCWDERADCVAVDDRAGSAAAVEHLVALGHSRIAHITGPLLEDATRAARGAGYETAMAAHGLSSVVGGPGDVARYVADGVSAFTAGNDVMAVQLIDAVEARGLSVPGDVSVVGFDGIELGGHSRIALTTVAQPRAQLMTRGLELLLQRMHGEDGPARHVQLTPELVVRGSSAPPR